MPTAVDKLTKNSSADEIRDAVSACIAQERENGREEDQAIAMCFDMARTKTGKARTELLSRK